MSALDILNPSVNNLRCCNIPPITEIKTTLITPAVLPLRVILRGVAFPTIQSTSAAAKNPSDLPCFTDLLLNVQLLSPTAGKREGKECSESFSVDDFAQSTNNSSILSQIEKCQNNYNNGCLARQEGEKEELPQQVLEQKLIDENLLELKKGLTKAVLLSTGMDTDTIDCDYRSSFTMEFYVKEPICSTSGSNKNLVTMVPLFPPRKGNDCLLAIPTATTNFFGRALITSSCCDKIIEATSPMSPITYPELFIVMRIRGGKGKAGFQKQLKKKGREYYRRAVVSAQHRGGGETAERRSGEGNEDNDSRRPSSVFDRGNAAVLSRLSIHKTTNAATTTSSSSRFFKPASSAHKRQKTHGNSNNIGQKNCPLDSHSIRRSRLGERPVTFGDDTVARDIIDAQSQHRQELNKWRQLLCAAAREGMTVAQREIPCATPRLDNFHENASHIGASKMNEGI